MWNYPFFISMFNEGSTFLPIVGKTGEVAIKVSRSSIIRSLLPVEFLFWNDMNIFYTGASLSRCFKKINPAISILICRYKTCSTWFTLIYFFNDNWFWLNPLKLKEPTANGMKFIYDYFLFVLLQIWMDILLRKIHVQKK